MRRLVLSCWGLIAIQFALMETPVQAADEASHFSCKIGFREDFDREDGVLFTLEASPLHLPNLSQTNVQLKRPGADKPIGIFKGEWKTKDKQLAFVSQEIRLSIDLAPNPLTDISRGRFYDVKANDVLDADCRFAYLSSEPPSEAARFVLMPDFFDQLERFRMRAMNLSIGKMEEKQLSRDVLIVDIKIQGAKDERSLVETLGTISGKFEKLHPDWPFQLTGVKSEFSN